MHTNVDILWDMLLCIIQGPAFYINLYNVHVMGCSILGTDPSCGKRSKSAVTNPIISPLDSFQRKGKSKEFAFVKPRIQPALCLFQAAAASGASRALLRTPTC